MRLLLAVLVFIVSAAPASAQDPTLRDRMAIERLHRQDVEATLSDKADELAKLWDDEAVRMQPGRPAEIGKATIVANDKQWEATKGAVRTLCYKSEIRDLQISGDWAFEWGYFSYRESSSAGPMRGKVLRVMKRQPDGSWKFARVIGFPEKLDSAAPMSDSCTASAAPVTVFRDCADCPEMVAIPAGSFVMGSSASDKSWAASHGGNLESVADESPQHVVALRTFALGKYDVTRGEYAAFVRETGHPAGDGCGPDSFKWDKQAGVDWRNPGFSQTDRDPVVCVSWQDAQAYVSWLNGKVRAPGSASTGGPYRLPSESEWEYAARAGTTTRFWWGDDDTGADDHAWYKGNSGGKTHPAGSKPSNAFGLYDMAGNVWQWTQDCYADSYATAPADGSANEAGEAGKPCMRVDRGSSWLYPAWLLRPATRERNPADYRDVIMGFRLARTLP